MKDREDKYRKIDKSDWDKGKWQTEPDEATWVDSESGHKVDVTRSPETGAYRFAVGVPKGHAAFGLEHAPGLAGYDAAMEPGQEGTDGLWWFAYRFDREHHGRPGQRMNIEMYRDIHAVQEAVRLLCRELEHFEALVTKPVTSIDKRQVTIDEAIAARVHAGQDVESVPEGGGDDAFDPSSKSAMEARTVAAQAVAEQIAQSAPDDDEDAAGRA